MAPRGQGGRAGVVINWEDSEAKDEEEDEETKALKELERILGKPAHSGKRRWWGEDTEHSGSFVGRCHAALEFCSVLHASARQAQRRGAQADSRRKGASEARNRDDACAAAVAGCLRGAGAWPSPPLEFVPHKLCLFPPCSPALSPSPRHPTRPAAPRTAEGVDCGMLQDRQTAAAAFGLVAKLLPMAHLTQTLRTSGAADTALRCLHSWGEVDEVLTGDALAVRQA